MSISGIIIRGTSPDAFERSVSAQLQALSGTLPGFYRLEQGNPIGVEGYTARTHSEGWMIRLSPLNADTECRLPVLFLQEEAATAIFLSGQLPASLRSTPVLTLSIAIRSNGCDKEMTAGRFRILSYSPKNTKTTLVREVALLFQQAIVASGSGYLKTRASLPDFQSSNSYRPTTRLRHLFEQLFTTTKWNIGIIHRPIQEIATEKGPFDVEWLSEAPGSDFKADPFGFVEDKKDKIFFEYYDAASRTGYLKTIDEKGEYKFLQSPTHLSYPYPVEINGKHYILPESAAAKSTTLYAIDSHQPEAIFSMLTGEQIIDPTLFQYEGKWWLFCTKKEWQGADLRLCIYYSGSEKGPWIPHAANPVKTDICSARPGGTPFLLNGKLIRPAQDSSTGYGSALMLMEIIELTPTIFKEQLYRRLEPLAFSGPYTAGIHTLSSMGNKTLIDGKRRKYTLQPFLRLLVK